MATVTSVENADDNDPSIVYSGSWTVFQAYSSSGSSTSLHSTTENGASATFTFQGFNAVEVKLIIPACSGSVVGSWTRDGQTGKVGIPCTSNVQQDYSFYPFTACSSFGPNTIVVRNSGSVPFQLDRFVVGNITSSTSSSTPNTTPSTMTTTSTAAVTSNLSDASISQGTSPSSTSVIGAGVTEATALNAGYPSSTVEGVTTGGSSYSNIYPIFTGTSNGTSNNTSSSFRSLPLGAIIGGVLGVLALIFLFVFFLVRYRPWQRGRSNRAEMASSSTLTPFSIPTTQVGHLVSDDKTVLTTTKVSLPLSSAATTDQSPQTSSTGPQSDINNFPTTSNSQDFQSMFSNVVPVLTDVPPAYDSLRTHIPLGSSQAQINP